ncbi:MAG: hypothetical protein HOJ89_00160 [Opitutales bacterium]|nr:hypothetical protein [Opitutales bacterium]
MIESVGAGLSRDNASGSRDKTAPTGLFCTVTATTDVIDFLQAWSEDFIRPTEAKDKPAFNRV